MYFTDRLREISLEFEELCRECMPDAMLAITFDNRPECRDDEDDPSWQLSVEGGLMTIEATGNDLDAALSVLESELSKEVRLMKERIEALERKREQMILGSRIASKMTRGPLEILADLSEGGIDVVHAAVDRDSQRAK